MGALLDKIPNSIAVCFRLPMALGLWALAVAACAFFGPKED